MHKVNRRECLEAMRYFFEQGFIEDLTSDKKYYVNILLKKVANDYNVELKGIDDNDTI